MKNNKKWSSLILAMWIVLIISLMAYNILEYIVPFSKEIKWVENSSISYYLANSWIEDGLFFIKGRSDINEKNEDSKSFNWKVSYAYATFSSGWVLPPLWEWNSNYDDDDSDWVIDHNWNTILQWWPFQLSIWNWYLETVTDFNISFRVPDLDWWINIVTWYKPETLSWWTDLAILTWQLSSISNTINSSWWTLYADDIFDSSKKSFSSNHLDLFDDNFTWSDTNWNYWIKLKDFYTNNCTWTNSWCTLKFSVVNDLFLSDTDFVRIPYLEWKLDVSPNWDLPLRYSKIEAKWKSMWYKKELEIKIPRKTVNQAFDFTVFQ